MLWWCLSGPAAFTQRCVAAFQAGECLLVGKPSHAPPELDDAVMQAIERRTYLEVRSVALDDGEPLDQIASQLDVGPFATMDNLVSHPRLNRTIIRLIRRGGSAGAQGVNTFVQRFLLARKRAGLAVAETPRLWVDLLPALIRPDAEKASSPGEHRVVLWRGCVRRADMAAYVAALMNGRPGPGPWRLYEAIVRHFAEFDRTFAEEISGWSNEALMRMPQELQFLAEQSEQRKEPWAVGGSDLMDGAPRTHALFDAGQAAGSTPCEQSRDALLRRLWKAQVEEILPWLAEHRMAGLKPYATTLEPILRQGVTDSFGTRLNSMVDVEFNDACYLLERRGVDLRNHPLLYQTRIVRNDLSHQDPLPASRIKALEQAWRAFVPGIFQGYP